MSYFLSKSLTWMYFFMYIVWSLSITHFWDNKHEKNAQQKILRVDNFSPFICWTSNWFRDNKASIVLTNMEKSFITHLCNITILSSNLLYVCIMFYKKWNSYRNVSFYFHQKQHVNTRAIIWLFMFFYQNTFWYLVN